MNSSLGQKRGEQRIRIHTQAVCSTFMLQLWPGATLRPQKGQAWAAKGEAGTAAGTVGNKCLLCHHLLPLKRPPENLRQRSCQLSKKNSTVCGVRMVQDVDSSFPSALGHGARGVTVPGSAGPNPVQSPNAAGLSTWLRLSASFSIYGI